MAPTRRQLLASVPLVVVLTGCLGDDDDATEPTPTATQTPSPSPTPQPTPTPTPTPVDTIVTTEHPDLGAILTDADGMILYMFDQDEQNANESTCYDTCASTWPPMVVEDEPSAGEGVTAEMTTFERADGSLQVAAAGWPLYYYAGDDEPGEANGQGFNDVWWVLRDDGTVVRDGEDEEEDDDNGDGYGY